nr:unnamed protein product [Callosobruchus analis]
MLRIHSGAFCDP